MVFIIEVVLVAQDEMTAQANDESARTIRIDEFLMVIFWRLRELI